ncbi:MAG TPA: radical SAM protein, partial [Dehalococcoidia bacterium]|nr:radical SAM protein [Dehalococcoidia bacterium]
ELVRLWEDPRLCRHFHLALQSGSPGVLARMRRRYSQDQYRDAVRRLREAVPDVAITTDVIVGFPGETDAEFEESYEFCREMAFAGIHVFPYSDRAGTVAAHMAGKVPEQVKKERVHRLIELSKASSAEYRKRFLAATVTVLWETCRESGDGVPVWEGLTDTYIRVRAASPSDLTNRLTPARISGLTDEGLAAEVIA